MKENIEPLSASYMVENGLKLYGKETIEHRAIPDFRDGLKPVQRRLLYDMYDRKILPDKGLKKSSFVVGDTMARWHPHGDCLCANTLVPLLNGEKKTIFELTKEGKPKWVLSFDEENNKYVPTIAHSWRVGQITDVVYEIELANGDVYTATANHLFLSIDKGWIRTDTLKLGTEIVGGVQTEDKYLILNSTVGKHKLHELDGNADEDTQDSTPTNIVPLTRIDTSEAVGLTQTSHSQENVILNCDCSLSKTLKCFSKIMQYALKKGYLLKNLTWKLYDKVAFSFMKKNDQLLDKVIFVSSEKLKEKFGEVSPIELLYNTSASFVMSVTKRTLPQPIKMYDFTVDKYHNMVICSNRNNFIVTHNSSIFSSLVNMVHDRYPLVYGSGNWGDEYSPAAAPRYIDCRLNEIALELFDYIDIAEFTENYSGDLKEPLVLPSKIPLLLMNGSSGIAVGVSSTIPPHNLKELVKAFKLLVEKPESSIKDLCKYIKGPDYVSGILVSPPKKIREVYEKGHGSLTFRCQYSFVVEGKLNVLKIFNLAPYFNKDLFLKKCDDLVSKKLIDYAIDESANGEHKLLLGFKDKNIVDEKILPMLYKSVSYQFYITERSEDKVFFKKVDLKSLMLKWLDYQRNLKKKYYNFVIKELTKELNKLKARLIATKHINVVVKALKDPDPVSKLIQSFNIDKKYALLILDCKVGSLAKASVSRQESKINSLRKKISTYSTMLDSINDCILKDLDSLSKFFDKRNVMRERNIKS